VLPENVVGKDTVYMLRIQGESMIEAGILDGDYVIVHQQSTAKNGDIVVAMTEEDEATVKTFYKEKKSYSFATGEPNDGADHS
jgi:repressor LexA